MKKTRLDLSILENADEKTMNAVGGENIPLSDKDKERLFKMSIQKADGNYTPEGEVSGVEITHRRSFMPAVASAAAVLVLAGAGGGLLYWAKPCFRFQVCHFVLAIRSRPLWRSGFRWSF